MFYYDTKKIYTSKMSDDSLELYTNEEVKKLLYANFPNFQMGYIPENYDVAFMLVKENLEDSFKDEWKIAFFKKTLDFLSGGTITLDNLDAMDNAEKKYEIYKVLDGSYENVISVSCDLISKHKANLSSGVST
jgi:hypothetical protein